MKGWAIVVACLLIVFSTGVRGRAAGTQDEVVVVLHHREIPAVEAQQYAGPVAEDRRVVQAPPDELREYTVRRRRLDPELTVRAQFVG